jgi:RimJ/RimL family protein N-acetyltransferase
MPLPQGRGEKVVKMMQNPYLIGTQVYLRPLEKADAPFTAFFFNDPEVRRNVRRYHPQNEQMQEEYIQNKSQDEHVLVLGIVVRATDRLIGITSLHEIDFRNRRSCFGLVIGVQEEWGKGHGTEATGLMVGHAFETLNLNRVWLNVFENNPAGIRIYEKIGFRREGILRQDAFHSGRYWDTYIMAILREEWLKKQ